MLYLLYKLGSFLALNLPTKIIYWIAGASGSAYYFLAQKDRRVLTENLKTVFGPQASADNVNFASRLVFVNFARYLIEFFRSAKIDADYLKQHVTIEGKEHLDQALAEGKGVLLAGAHLGNWELGAMVVSMLGYPINIIAWTHQDKRINNLFARRREDKGVKIIPLGLSMRQVFKALKNNELIAILADIDFLNPDSGLPVKFFGKTSIMPKGPAMFGLKTKAAIVPTFCVRDKKCAGKFKLIFGRPIFYQQTYDHQQDVFNLTQKVTDAIEHYIRFYPEQWFMLRPRWQE